MLNIEFIMLMTRSLIELFHYLGSKMIICIYPMPRSAQEPRVPIQGSLGFPAAEISGRVENFWLQLLNVKINLIYIRRDLSLMVN